MPQQWSVPVPTRPRVTHPVAASCTEATGAGEELELGHQGTTTAPALPRSNGVKEQERKRNTNRCTDRSEHVEEQMGADHHRTSKVASANVAPGDRKSQCHPFALSL